MVSNDSGFCAFADFGIGDVSHIANKGDLDRRQMAVTEDPVQWRALVFVVFSLQVLLPQRARLYGDGF